MEGRLRGEWEGRAEAGRRGKLEVERKAWWVLDPEEGVEQGSRGRGEGKREKGRVG